MKHRYLINNKVYGSSTEMPKKTELCCEDYEVWQQSLTELPCDESELYEIRKYKEIVIDTNEPIDITSITTIRDGKVYFKEVESESNFIETYDKEWILGFVKWYSGTNEDLIKKAFKEYIKNK